MNIQKVIISVKNIIKILTISQLPLAFLSGYDIITNRESILKK